MAIADAREREMDAEAIAVTLHTAVQDCVGFELPADLSHVAGLAFELKCCCSWHHA